MRLDAVAHTRSGLSSTTRLLTRSDGEPVHMHNPLFLLDDGIAAIPHAELDGDEQIRIDLTAWSLWDMECNRATGLELTGPPGTDFVSRVAARYVREARHLPQHERREWVENIIAEAAA